VLNGVILVNGVKFNYQKHVVNEILETRDSGMSYLVATKCKPVMQGKLRRVWAQRVVVLGCSYLAGEEKNQPRMHQKSPTMACLKISACRGTSSMAVLRASYLG